MSQKRDGDPPKDVGSRFGESGTMIAFWMGMLCDVEWMESECAGDMGLTGDVTDPGGGDVRRW